MKQFITLCIGIAFGVSVSSATAQQQPQGITRKDLMEAAALCGILANNSHDPFGSLNLMFIRGPQDFVNCARKYSEIAR